MKCLCVPRSSTAELLQHITVERVEAHKGKPGTQTEKESFPGHFTKSLRWSPESKECTEKGV